MYFRKSLKIYSPFMYCHSLLDILPDISEKSRWIIRFYFEKVSNIESSKNHQNHTFVFLLIHHKELLLVVLWKPTKTFLSTSEIPPRTTMKFSRKPMKNIFLGISEKPQKLSIMQHRWEFPLSNKINWLFWILVRDEYELSFASLHTTILTFVSSVW